MEVNNNNQQSPVSSLQSHLKPYLVVVVALIAFILGGVGGYLLGNKSSAKQVTNTAVQPTQTIPNSQSMDKFNNITYLMKYRDAGPANEKTLFVTKDNTGESFKVADINMNDASTKTVYKFDFPSAVGFNPPFYITNNYVVAPVAGADANDILIFTLNGDVISKGVRQDNTELSNWIVSYDEVLKNNLIKVKLFQIDNSIATAQVDISTGKIVPGSLVKLGKVQQ